MSEDYVFLNGEILESPKACLSVFDRGLLYGDGLFETMRVESGKVLFLKAHLERLSGSCRFLKMAFEPQNDAYWEENIRLLLSKNGLEASLAAVKIVVTRGISEGRLGLPSQEKPTIIMYARKYVPPSKEKYSSGITVEVFPYPRHSFLADYKSLNYLFYLSAREWAQRRGADEAMVLNADGTVSEGATSNVFYVKDGSLLRPASPHYLRGIMEDEVVRLLEEEGKKVETVPTTVGMLTDAEEVFMTNSLMGIIPVAGVGERMLPERKALAVTLQGVDWIGRSTRGPL